MVDIDPFAERPLYEESQVLTTYDVIAVLNGFIHQHNEIPRWRFIQRIKMRVVIEMMCSLLAWLDNGKKMDGTKAVSK